MSAGAAGVFAPATARMPLHTNGPRLRLVGSDERVWAPATRLTRRGRLVSALLAAVAVATLAVVLATSVDAAAPQIDHATTVLSGQTLSEVAATQLPSVPIHNAVAWIQLANGLSSSQVHAGQSLLIPALP